MNHDEHIRAVLHDPTEGMTPDEEARWWIRDREEALERIEAGTFPVHEDWSDRPDEYLAEARENLAQDLVDFRERHWYTCEPFHDPTEDDALAEAAVYGCDEAWARLRDHQTLRDMRRHAASHLQARTLSAADLRSMRAWDKACYWDRPSAPHVCEIHGCDDHDHDSGRHDEGCPWSAWCGDGLEAHGQALHEGDPTFWDRLRRLGATPELVAEANAILQPARHALRTRRQRPTTNRSGARRRTGQRNRGTGSRPAPRRTTTRSSARSGDSGDDGPAAPSPPAVHLWRHPVFGAVTPALLRILVREAQA